jgi:hypothetical protein
MDHGSAQDFADGWVAAWNAHDIEAVLSHFCEDARFSSPVAQAILDGTDGVLVGKDAIRSYWAEGIRRIPDLHFEVVGTYVGVDLVVINYRNQRGVLVCEVLHFDGDLVVEGAGTYLGQPI